MSDILFCSFYTLLFSAIIMRSKWFSADSLSNKYFLGAFYLKLLFGVALWYIYTHIYHNRATSDIFKYYDDAQMMFGKLHSSAKEYLIMLTGIGDSGKYYQDFYHFMNSWGNGYGTSLYSNSHFIISMNAFFMLFSQGHYGVHVIFMCFISFAGLTYVYKAFLPFLQEKSKMLFAAVFLFPSVILWSSGVLKEGFIWLGLGLSIYYFFKLINNPLKKDLSLIAHILYLSIGFVILFESKAYVLICIFPCFIGLFLIKKIAFCKTRPLITFLSVLFFYLGSAALPHLLFNSVDPLAMLSDKQMDFNRSSRGGIYLAKINDSSSYAFISVADSVNIVPLNLWADTLLHKKGIQYLVTKPFWQIELKSRHRAPYMLRKGTPYELIEYTGRDTLHLTATDSTIYWVCIYVENANSKIYIDPIQSNLLSLLGHIPQALKIAMLLPYPWQVHSAMTAIYCAENVFVLLLIFISLFFLKRPVNMDLALFCLLYSLLMLILIGLVTPILGGIERYKSVVIPFMFILLLLITDTDKILQRFKLKK